MISKALHPSQYRRLGLWSTAALTACTGAINLLSAVAPKLMDRVLWLRAISPFDVRASAHFFSALSGFFLLMLAANHCTAHFVDCCELCEGLVLR
jgi:phosphatidylglycerol lysyltransferase